MKNSQRPMLLFSGMCIFSLQWILTHQQDNVAVNGIATQSSMYMSFDASRAIDGNRASDLGSGSCAHTHLDYNPWWRVDLLGVYDIKNVIITNRGDGWLDRINGVEIRIGNSIVNNGNNNPRCVVISTIAAGVSENFICNMRGRYVNLIAPDDSRYLNFCEVEVYGFPVLAKTAFLRLKFKSNEDLTESTMRDNVLQKVAEIPLKYNTEKKKNWSKNNNKKNKCVRFWCSIWNN